ncbi:DUF6538 domain-containing protein [Brevundimonas sp. SL130]|uniref:DUF6538 domain-containing protein n=1 Tax=Brevundimonas sp. SL130 TaxID=2995143 RepID=UPI002D1E3739|nr:DUF6538 domain-containing protein [Brevundimonas sp. SL130]
MDAVHGCAHLYRRGAVYQFRRRVPEDVSGDLGITQWRESLHTRDFEEAKRLARERGVATDALIVNARAKAAGKASLPLNKTDAARMANAWIGEVLEFDEATRTGRGESGVRGAHLWLEEATPDYRRALATLDITSVTPEVDKALAQAGLWYPPGDPSREILGLALLRAQVRLLDLMERRLSGQVVEPPSEAPQASSGAVGGITLGQLITLYKAERMSAHGGESTERKYGHVFRALEEALGTERAIRGITRADIRQVRDLLRRVPAHVGKRFPGLSLTEAADRADATGAQRLAPNTVKSYLQNLSAMLHWAVKEEHIDRNPAVGLLGKDRAVVKRRGFKPDELAVLFSALEAERARMPWKYWLSAIALYSGARAGEIAPLRTADIVQIDGVWCMNFSEFDEEGRRIEERRLKTEPSARRTPLHPALVEAGFLAFVEARRKAGDEVLFPQLRPGPGGNHSHDLSKWFGRFRSDLGLSAPATPFHAFRHGFRDACREAGLSEEVAAALGGWAGRGLVSKYGDRGMVSVLDRELRKISYAPFNLPAAP